ncbi:Phospholipase D beta 1 [Morus notabilis]|uniref:Phospholipase D alpha 1 n=1 Tax=Morus notabilis TaxID=981085 RepID=W9RV00_9ROSA|nr:Phospholipase D beta 1 [Morus notabilis]
MDNYGSSNSYPYQNSYTYPHNTPPNPPPQYPPPISDPYPPAPAPAPAPASYPYPYQYNSAYSSQAYPQQPFSTSHSGPVDYHHPPPTSHYSPPYLYPYPCPAPPVAHGSSQPSLQHHDSFQYGSSSGHFHNEQSTANYPSVEVPSPQVAPRADSFSNHHYHRQESYSYAGVGNSAHHEFDAESVSSTTPLVYPPLDDLLSNVHLSDSHPTAPASPPAPAVPTSSPQSARYDRHGEFYGYPNSSFSSNWEGSYLDQVGSPSHSVYSHSGSFNGSQHSQTLQIVPQQYKGSLKVLLLHGILDIWVYDAKNLPNMDMFHKTLGDMFARLPGNVTNKIEGHMKNKITSDPYVSIAVSNAVIGRTYVISNCEDPVWEQHFNVPVAHYAPEVHFVVKDSDVVGSQLIGVVAIPVEQIYSGARVEGVYPILNTSGKPSKQGAVLKLSIQYIPMEKLSIYHAGVGAGPNYYGVPGTYFPLRKGGRVTLYQDADVPDGCLPELRLDGDFSYVHGKCWQDIFDAIRQARRLIYITGWSVWHNVKLVRDASHASNFSLGDILRSKSQEGVRVLLLIWDDPTSRSILGYKTDGIMQTHDEETRRFFKHSSVQVLLCPRSAGKRHSWIKQRYGFEGRFGRIGTEQDGKSTVEKHGAVCFVDSEVETIYTHHQKTVIVDADAGNNRRKIIAFIGGLDLCDGRYDTPHHPLFRTLQTVHKDDYHNPTFTGTVAGCPREPWHDLHSRIDGPAAYDVLTNFEERWLKASKPQGMSKLKRNLYDDALLRLERIPDIIGLADATCTSENDPENWHVQIFRSIDSNSAKHFPKDPKDATSKNLVCGKNVLIDMSIHTAYVKAIRAAQHYIYIENQYFIGSSYNWSSYKDLGANNLIPMEIALKIADKIRANERFAAYIVIPMWPEGVPTGAATQRILFWQHKTMQMMYETIYKALVEAGLEGAYSPQDYLNFFCLGNREAVDGNDTVVTGSPAANTPPALSRKSRRFMIYVHSKGMIVDDEYVILGSANINQRSMEGTRDTEIAMGAYQPHHTWARKLRNPCGQLELGNANKLSGVDWINATSRTRTLPKYKLY